ncbi:MAG: glutaredoxin family protein [Bacteroidota bacterium]
MKRVTLYTKHECHLCEEAREVLQRVRNETPFSLEEVVIREGDPDYQKYQESVPVVTIEGAFAFKYRVNEPRLRELLKSDGESEAT